MHDLRDRRKLPHIDVTATTLKWYSCVTMLFYAVSVSVIQNGMLHVSRFSNGELREMWAADADLMILSSWAAVFQLLGGLAVPVFAFLLVEGFLHTKSFKGYLLRMLLFALVSEVPFDFAMGGKLFNWTQQDMPFTLILHSKFYQQSGRSVRWPGLPRFYQGGCYEDRQNLFRCCLL